MVHMCRYHGYVDVVYFDIWLTSDSRLRPRLFVVMEIHLEVATVPLWYLKLVWDLS